MLNQFSQKTLPLSELIHPIREEGPTYKEVDTIQSMLNRLDNKKLGESAVTSKAKPPIKKLRRTTKPETSDTYDYWRKRATAIHKMRNPQPNHLQSAVEEKERTFSLQ